MPQPVVNKCAHCNVSKVCICISSSDNINWTAAPLFPFLLILLFDHDVYHHLTYYISVALFTYCLSFPLECELRKSREFDLSIAKSLVPEKYLSK